jgi:hypothetical protein
LTVIWVRNSIARLTRFKDTRNFQEESRMKSLRSAFCALVFATITLTLVSAGHAQAGRTWVSGVGDDQNPCSRTAPCRTFAGAISKTATGGEIGTLDSGGFGSVTITKSITIDGTSSLAAILVDGPYGININITDSKDAEKSVRIRGLSLNGAGKGNNGINVMAANKVSVEDTVIDGLVNNGINISSGAVFVRNTSIRNNAGAGINVASGCQVALTDVSLFFNGTALVGATGSSISYFANVVVYGNKSGDPKAK